MAFSLLCSRNPASHLLPLLTSVGMSGLRHLDKSEVLNKEIKNKNGIKLVRLQMTPGLVCIISPFVVFFIQLTSFFFSAVLSRCVQEHAVEDVYEVVQSPQIAVLPVALHPGSPVVQGLRGWQGDRLSKVNHPHSGPPSGVVHKQKRATHNLSLKNQCDR